MKFFAVIISFFIGAFCFAQSPDTGKYSIVIDTIGATYFQQDSTWRGGDGASSVDLGNGRVLWLFGDSFISDSAGSRKKSELVRNSIALQQGYNINNKAPEYYWNKSKKKPLAFFHQSDTMWYWPGHGVMIKDKLLIFLIKEHEVKGGFGFETYGWDAVLISNPKDDPAGWKMKYLKVPETYGTVAGSAAVLQDDNYIYAYGAVEPGSHDVYLVRWKSAAAYRGDLTKPEWWMNDKWSKRESKDEIPQSLFNGATEYSVHYDSTLKKYIQVQAFGFGEATIGLRFADKLQGPWSEPYTIFTPDYTGIKRPFMYSAKAHPELHRNGVLITYNINSFDFDELLVNDAIYFPRFIRLSFIAK